MKPVDDDRGGKNIEISMRAVAVKVGDAAAEDFAKSMTLTSIVEDVDIRPQVFNQFIYNTDVFLNIPSPHRQLVISFKPDLSLVEDGTSWGSFGRSSYVKMTSFRSCKR